MKGVKKCLSCLLVFIGLFTGCLSFQCYAAEYGAIYPDYLSQSSACFVECETYLGKGSIVLPVNYKNDIIGFYGEDYELFNCTSSTITGQFVLEDGTTFTCRATSFNKFEVRSSDDYYNQYSELGVMQIYNTNVEFLDDTGERGNTIYSFTPFEQIVIVLLLFIVVLFVLLLLKKVY